MSTKFAEVKSNIRQRLSVNIGSISVLYDNMPKTQVFNGASMPNEFVHLHIYNVNHDIISVGSITNNKVRYSGVFDVNIFTPLAQGDKRANEICDIVANIFNNATFNNIDTRIDKIIDVGDGGQYYQTMIAIIFECDYNE